MTNYRALLIFRDGEKLIRPLRFTENKQYMPSVVVARDNNIHLNIRMGYSHYDEVRRTAVYHEVIEEDSGPRIA